MGSGDRALAIGSARDGGERVVGSPAFGWMARAGLIARGVVYGVVGLLAIKVAVGSGGKTTNQQGALETIAQQPFGRVLLIVVAAGLGGYAAWRLIRAAVGHGSEGRDKAPDRIAGAASGLVYAGLCVVAVKILAGHAAGGSSSSPKQTTAGVLGWSGGTALVAVAGAVLIGVALYQAYKGIAQTFVQEAKTEKMSMSTRRAYITLGVTGHFARMVVFGLTGAGLISAAVSFDPRKAIGLDGALSELAHDSYGPFLLAIVAAGLIAFALYSIADARYRRI